MRLTPEEKQFLALRRERIKLDSVDWYREPYVTQRDILEMSLSTAYRIIHDPLFRYCIRDQVYYNMRNDVGANDVQERVIISQTCLSDQNVPDISAAQAERKRW